MALTEYIKARLALKNGTSAPAPKKEPKPIPKKSKKRIQEDKEYKRISKELKDKSAGQCVVKSPVCTKFSEGIHHVQKTSPINRKEKNNLKPCCNACNRYVEEHPEWAIEHGHQVSRFAIPESHEIPEDDPDDFS